ncbi:hypothetical protein EV647_2128 [Kribbella sp. VKM Ac-2566]|nr:hypothetical protein EV647_2128 [Kribbella sp. VKM Ac-2566]
MSRVVAGVAAQGGDSGHRLSPSRPVRWSHVPTFASPPCAAVGVVGGCVGEPAVRCGRSCRRIRCLVWVVGCSALRDALRVWRWVRWSVVSGDALSGVVGCGDVRELGALAVDVVVGCVGGAADRRSGVWFCWRIRCLAWWWLWWRSGIWRWEGGLRLLVRGGWGGVVGLGVEGGAVGEFLGVVVEGVGFDQLQVEVGCVVEDAAQAALAGDHGEDRDLDAVD